MMNSGTGSRKKSFREFLSRKEYLIILLFFLALLAIFYYTLFTPNYFNSPSPVTFEIRRGETLNQVINKLYRGGIIPTKFNMKVAAFIYGAEKRLRAGRYYLQNGQSYLDLVNNFP